jgi:hypothetical protein
MVMHHPEAVVGWHNANHTQVNTRGSIDEGQCQEQLAYLARS